MVQLRDEQITAVLDVTAEFAALDELSQSDDISYLNIPVLDHASPSRTQLQQAVNWLQRQRADGRKVLVHCALGRGRSVLVLAAFLLSRHNSRSAEKAVALIRQVRHTARLNKHQLAALRQFTDSYTEQGQQPVWPGDQVHGVATPRHCWYSASRRLARPPHSLALAGAAQSWPWKKRQRSSSWQAPG